MNGMTKHSLYIIVMIGIQFGLSLDTFSQNFPLPEGNNGIASNYQNDDGIESDSAVIFVENFEEETINEMTSRWETAVDDQYMSFDEDTPANSGGNHSLLITHTGGKGNGSQLYRRLQPGYKQVYARTYIKFDQDSAQIHHFGTHLGGFNPSTPWPQGGAGVRPDGSKRFTSGVEPYGTNWNWDFYSYWQGMHVHGDGNYWGTPFLSGNPKPTVKLGEWICVEMMIKVNDPVTESNGEQAFWINGKLWRVDEQIVSHAGKGFPKGKWAGGWWEPDANASTTFDGFQWRNVDELMVNYIWTYVYITKAPQGHVSKIWFDDIVVAKEYIGPISGDSIPANVNGWSKQ